MLTEPVQIVDDYGCDLLLVGTVGSVVGIEGSVLTMKTSKGVYEDIPISSVRSITEEKAA
jgi:hypothetical protein